PRGRGLAGMATYVAITVAEPWSDTLTIPGHTLDVKAEVVTVEVDWGDGTQDRYQPNQYDLLSGYPDGVASHTYQTKTCHPNTNPADVCRPHPYPISVTYMWDTQWRTNNGDWNTLDIPPTTTSV